MAVHEQSGGCIPLVVEVCYAPPPPGVLSRVPVQLGPGSTVADAIRASGVLARHPEIDLATNKVGIFGKLANLDGTVVMHDRIEIYRALSADPKIARQRRVEKIRANSIEGRKWQGREKC
jgi:putative ubiquitin-RnfH superfamily antitoxin RatB of RatAB toxin-antitoxin module